MATENKNALVIVESPAKARTLEKYLGKGFKVRASVGHVIDLPKRTFGVDIENDFEPKYEVMPEKKKVVSELKKAAKDVDTIYLAPDPDREGEAIAWHIARELGNGKREYFRVLINEITKQGVKRAFDNPSTLNEDKFHSQQARRILDRLVGYQLSPLLQKKVQRGLSAGRVQSVAVRIVCEREREIQAFQSQEYWSITATLLGKNPPEFEAKVFRIGKDKVEVGTIPNEKDATRIVDDLKDGKFEVSNVTKKERRKNPEPPFVTAKLQQDASRKLGLSAKQVMALAQALYEGMPLGDEGSVGLITYMRTDSPRIAPEAQQAARDLVNSKYGKDYLPPKPPVYKSRKSAQEAHEAIRPTDLSYTPEMVKSMLGQGKRNHARLYELIYQRFLASQMAPAILDQTTIDIQNGDYLLRATGSVIKFNGFMAVYTESREEADAKDDNDDKELRLPVIEEGEILKLIKLEPGQHFTQPPPRFTEASLVKELEDKGIGRPSTYASILSTIQDRGYVLKEKKKFSPTELGTITNDLLVESFPDILNVEFTAGMEDKLDLIEEGKLAWIKVLKEFYGPFSETLEDAKKNMRNIKQERIQHTDIPCEKCGAEMVIRWGKNGEFMACSAYPACKNTMNFTKDDDGNITPMDKSTQAANAEKLDINCPDCSKPLTVKKGRRGEFLGCTGYPDCRFTSSFLKKEDESIVMLAKFKEGDTCPSCGGTLEPKRGKLGQFLGCSKYPDCKLIIPQKGKAAGSDKSEDKTKALEVDESVKCDQCGSGMVRRKGRYGEFYGCSTYPKCRGIKKIPKESK